MNKEAIALAADSAVTRDQSTGPKIFQSANKIFTLSKYHPIGIMIYNNSAFMEVPWEIIIKTYRNRLGERAFSTVEELADHFIDHLGKEKTLKSSQQQQRFFENSIVDMYTNIRDDILERIRDFTFR